MIDDDLGGIDRGNRSRFLRTNSHTRIPPRHLLHTRLDQRRLAPQQRHRLPLHIRTHQRSVRVVVLEERYQRSRQTHNLLGRDVNVVDLFVRDLCKLPALPCQRHPLTYLARLRFHRAGRSEYRLHFLICPQEDNIISYLALFDLVIRRQQKTVFVNRGEYR